MHYNSAVDVLVKQLFPTVGAIDEELMIGRTEVVGALTDRLAGGHDALIIEPRQVGKSSVLRAVTQRLRRSDSAGVAQTDLKIDGVQNSMVLGDRLLTTAREAGAGGLSSAGTRFKAVAGRAGKAVTAPLEAVARAAEALGVSAEVTQVVSAVNEAFGRVQDVPFDRVLAVLEADAQLRSTRTAVVLDEVQEIGTWGADGEAVEEALAAAVRRPDRRLAFVFAGSERHAVETLFADGRPLRVVSDRFAFPSIAADDWANGIRDRMRRGHLDIDDAALEALLAASKGHPLCTMHLAKEAYLAARAEPSRTVTSVHVEAGLAQSAQQLWWKEFTSG